MSTASPAIRPRLELSLQYDEGQLRSQLASVARVAGGERKALGRAVNRALQGTRTDIVADLRARLPLKAKTIRSGIFVHPALWRSHTSCDGYVRVSTGGVPLMEYEVRPLRPTAQRGRRPSQFAPMRYRLERGGKQFGNAPRREGLSKRFIATTAKGKLAVFARIGDDRQRLSLETGPSLQFWYALKADQERILRGADGRFRKELAHQVEHLSGGGR